MAMGWPFFYFITYGGKKEKTEDKTEEKKDNKGNPNRKKWFQLNHTVINHPKNGYEEHCDDCQ